MSHIFISYSRKDIDFAQKVVDALAANNLDTWIDWKSIPKGEDWEQEIYRGIEEADAFLFLISPDSVSSQMCKSGDCTCSQESWQRSNGGCRWSGRLSPQWRQGWRGPRG
jgi:TIR domain